MGGRQISNWQPLLFTKGEIMTALADIEGVGEKYAEKLKAVGVNH